MQCEISKYWTDFGGFEITTLALDPAWQSVRKQADYLVPSNFAPKLSSVRIYKVSKQGLLFARVFGDFSECV